MTGEALYSKKVTADVLRLDEIHRVVSGNKSFKLKYYLEDALEKNYKTVLTFGGAWSNHIIATAFACREAGLQSIGVIRGEQPSTYSITLQSAITYGMLLAFVKRKVFKQVDKTELISGLTHRYGPLYIIPEGGAGALGIKGSKEIAALLPGREYSHVMCCIGTGTMFLGLAASLTAGMPLVGIPVLKGLRGLSELNPDHEDSARMKQCSIIDNYHFGGYAKKTPGLITFMNEFYAQHGIPTDFVYTAKLMFAFTDLLKKSYFPPSSRVLIIHSGGLQGNASLPPGTLAF